MLGWLKSIKVTIVAFAAILTWSGFKVNSWDHPNLLILAFVVVVTAATMAQDSWRDRQHDRLRKGKDFVCKREKTFFVFVMLLWLISVLMAVSIFNANKYWGIISLVIIFLGSTYSEIRLIPLLPNFVVAITFICTLLYSFNHGMIEGYLLIVATFLLVFGREIITDSRDRTTDGGYKWTLPLKLGERNAKLIAGMVVISAVPSILYLFIPTFFGAVFLIMAGLHLMYDKDNLQARKILDCGLAFTLLSIILFYP